MVPKAYAFHDSRRNDSRCPGDGSRRLGDLAQKYARSLKDGSPMPALFASLGTGSYRRRSGNSWGALLEQVWRRKMAKRGPCPGASLPERVTHRSSSLMRAPKQVACCLHFRPKATQSSTFL